PACSRAQATGIGIFLAKARDLQIAASNLLLPHAMAPRKNVPDAQRRQLPALEVRLSLLDERPYRLLMILSALRPQHPLSLAVDGRWIGQLHRFVEIVLDIAKRDARPVGERASKRNSLLLQRLV